jgi:hypothetical protein
MDPITTTLIEAATRLAEPAVHDAYNAVKSLIMTKFGRNPKVAGALDGLEEEPATWSKPLDSALNSVGASQDTELKELLSVLESALKVGNRVGGPINHHGTGDVVMGSKAGRDVNTSTTTISTGGGSYVGGNVINKNDPK